MATAHAQVDVFARLPVPGQVKTRLAARLGAEPASEFYAACAEHICRQCARCCIMQDLPCTHQASTSDLGLRMQAALQSALKQDGIAKAIVVGTDIPDIKTQIIDDAVATLDEYEQHIHPKVVLGPAVDGGYYLIGVTRAPVELFQNIEWSTDKVLQQTMRQAQQLGVRVAPTHTLPTLQDIDTIQDLQQWHTASSKAVAQQDPGHPLLHLVTSLLKAGDQMS